MNNKYNKNHEGKLVINNTYKKNLSKKVPIINNTKLLFAVW